MTQIPLISVVIATFNRRDVLKVTLDNLSQQSITPSDFEVVVVDDGSDDGTSELVKSLIPSMPYNLRFFRHENRGPGFTQNRGIQEARSNLVVLMADDVWPTPDTLRHYLETHREYPDENVAVLGKVLQSPELPPTVMHKYWDPFMYYRFNDLRELDSVFFLACNISVKKSFLLKHGMYKERKGAAHEDIELGYRLGLSGLRIIYEKDAMAYHYHAENLSNACRRAYERGWNFDMLSENIPNSFIFPLYHICSLKAGQRAFLRMLPREVPRMIIFNKWSVRYFWCPVLELAERNRFASLFANGRTYRGTIHYHQRAGYKDKKKEKRTSKAGRNPVAEVKE